MGKLPKQILAEKENVEIALKYLEIAMEREEKSVIELAAIATFLHPTFKVEVQQKQKRSQAVFCSPGIFWACC